MIRKVCLVLGTMTLVLGVVFGVERVRYHVETEVVSVSAPRLASTRGELLREALHEGQHVVFEACSIERDAFGPTFVDALTFSVVVVDSGETALEVTTDAERIASARRNDAGVCIPIGDAASLGGSGVFALRVAPVGEPSHGLSHVPVVGRIVAVTPVSDADLLPVLLCLVGVVLLFLGATRARHESAREPIPRRAAYGMIALSSALLLASLFAGALLPRWGALAVLMNAALVALVELGCAYGVPRALGVPAMRLLAFEPPRRLYVLAVVPFVGVGLNVVGRLLTAYVPSTGVSPIETLVSQTSGFVAVALVSVLAPVVEELFFRGLVYGVVARAKSEDAATVFSFVIFVLVHVPQDFGAWGALASIAVTGAALVGLRRATGSVVVPAIAHVTYNAIITILSFAAHA